MLSLPYVDNNLRIFLQKLTLILFACLFFSYKRCDCHNFWIQTCNFITFFLCAWQNKTYLLAKDHQEKNVGLHVRSSNHMQSLSNAFETFRETVYNKD